MWERVVRFGYNFKVEAFLGIWEAEYKKSKRAQQGAISWDVNTKGVTDWEG